MSMWWFLTTLVITAFICNSPSYAYDNNPLQDICVAVNDSKAAVFVNGKICKDPKFATPNDFFASGLNVSGTAVPGSGAAAKFLTVDNIPGLNTLGISIGRIDLEPQGLAPLHTHPRATELITVLEGTLYVGFLVPDRANFFKSRLFSKILYPGDVFVFPIGLIHFQYNVGNKKATYLAAFNSQNPGFVIIPNSIFASNPPIPDDVLTQGFQLSKTQIAELRKKFS
ncbi:germin-like protein subfamily 1 member 13 isoform X3 [Solanum stenotomum]|uniref:germin-like protein subfamily 1 member 13 isoform X3 n=1 Tax=Solanum stenotomum TaxID=172797 RepID=UPI0020D04FC4|nr:germin-like protein subfamily 1 member 13 isoform X3 [Solanum stenotomum]